jgi:hypothetical protein
MKTHKYKIQICVYNIRISIKKLQRQDNKQRRKMKLESSEDFDINIT